ncbi:hypothetical protein swp_2673 [Shewanella piezotolerans WP3]|uniref:Uncharacterized protein n=1 Tax=Shewanella piezotolerans (strain WP3 / JCM 13877) TaxID=225849 RepID=B8CML6_SHEPW|nr:hypothetical protein swp_2673 [Shewanella piezotolerans WP3]
MLKRLYTQQGSNHELIARDNDFDILHYCFNAKLSGCQLVIASFKANLKNRAT